MSSGRSDDRLERLRALLGREGVHRPVDVAGREGEIAVVRSEPSLRPALSRLAPEIRALGFRYVALELDQRSEPGAS